MNAKINRKTKKKEVELKFLARIPDKTKLAWYILLIRSKMLKPKPIE